MEAEDFVRQAGMTAEEYMRMGITAIDAEFGPGFAKKNPALLAAFMTTAAKDFEAMWLGERIDKASVHIGEALLEQQS